MYKFFFLFILLSLTLEVVAFSLHENDFTQARQESLGMSTTELEKINDVILKRVKNGDIPGAVVAISRQGERVFVSSQGLMDPQKKIPMRPRNYTFAYTRFVMTTPKPLPFIQMVSC